MAASRVDMIARHLATILAIFLLVCSLDWVTLAQDDEWDEFLLCRQCGHEITNAVDLKRVASPQALRQRNDTILGIPGVLIQLFVNPLGHQFEVITTKKADVKKFNEVFPGDSWFPGYSWRIAVCPRCGQHLGW
ncbi:protein cereblon-like [Saccoglossus kowalevskii]